MSHVITLRADRDGAEARPHRRRRRRRQRLVPRPGVRLSQSAGATKLTLHGGEPHHPALAGLWRDKRLTDFAVSAEGVEFKAHRVALASSSKYFLNLGREYKEPPRDK